MTKKLDWLVVMFKFLATILHAINQYTATYRPFVAGQTTIASQRWCLWNLQLSNCLEWENNVYNPLKRFCSSSIHGPTKKGSKDWAINLPPYHQMAHEKEINSISLVVDQYTKLPLVVSNVDFKPQPSLCSKGCSLLDEQCWTRPLCLYNSIWQTDGRFHFCL